MEHSFISKRISYLHNLCGVLPGGAQSNMLKTHYLIKSRLLQAQSDKVLPAALTKTSSSCPRCCLPHGETGASHKIEPERPTKFSRKLLKKHDRGHPLTGYQQKFMRKLKGCRGNKLVVTCGLCKREVKIPLIKPPRVANNADETPAVKKRKRKRKDRFSGLDVSAVLSATPQRQQQNKTDASVKKKQTLTKILDKSKRSTKKPTDKLKDFLCSL